jgi:hypothetical protein
MNTKSVLGVVLAFGIAFSIIAGSGIGAAVFGEDAAGSESADTLGELQEQSSVDPDGNISEGESTGLSADVVGDNEPTLVGVAISGGQFLTTLVAAVALLPVTLIRLGFPAYAAVPIGGGAQVIAFIGLIQFVRTGELL